jgi:hypothetical protein
MTDAGLIAPLKIAVSNVPDPRGAMLRIEHAARCCRIG